jgi:hypothetical protein
MIYKDSVVWTELVQVILIRNVVAMPGDNIERREILFGSKEFSAELLNNGVIRS